MSRLGGMFEGREGSPVVRETAILGASIYTSSNHQETVAFQLLLPVHPIFSSSL